MLGYAFVNVQAGAGDALSHQGFAIDHVAA